MNLKTKIQSILLIVAFWVIALALLYIVVVKIRSLFLH
jgi:hypothetical protein